MIVGHTTEQSCRSVQREQVQFLYPAAVFFEGCAGSRRRGVRGVTVKNFLLMILMVCLPALLAHAQTGAADARKDSARMRAAVPVRPDTARTIAPRVLQPRRDTVVVMHWNEDSLIAARTATSDTVMRKGKSGTIAMLASMALPGAGQIYNGSYWKVPIIWGTAASFLAAYHFYDTNYKTYRDAYAASVRADSAKIGNTQLQDLRNYYASGRSSYVWYLAFTYLITIVDAYVDASLYNFEVSPDLQPHGEWKATLHIRLR
jgi:hypothetical protein